MLLTPPPSSTRIVRLWGEEEGSSRKKTDNTADDDSKFDMDDETISDYDSDAAARRMKDKQKERKEEEKRINERTDSSADGFLLPGIVKAYLAELEDEREKERKRNEETFGPLQTLKLNEYVVECRAKLHQERAQKKRDIIIQKMKRQADLRQEIKDTRLKAVENLLEEERQRRNVIGNVLKSVGFPVKSNNEGRFLDDEEGDGYTVDDAGDSLPASRAASRAGSRAGSVSESRRSDSPESRGGSSPGVSRPGTGG